MQAYPSAQKEGVEIIEPLDGILPSEKALLFKVKVPGAVKGMVGKTMMNLEETDVLSVETTPNEGEKDITMYASVSEESSSMQGYFKWKIES